MRKNFVGNNQNHIAVTKLVAYELQVCGFNKCLAAKQTNRIKFLTMQKKSRNLNQGIRVEKIDEHNIIINLLFSYNACFYSPPVGM